MRVLVTRPQPQADDWAARLAALGHDALALPLLAIGDAPDPAAVTAAWHALAQRTLAMFVSPSAVERFAAARAPGQSWPAGTLAGSTGPGTARALRDAAVPPDCIVTPADDSPSFDSEALWTLLRARRDWHGCSVLIVRGAGGRDWLAGQLRAAGATVDFVEAYRRETPRWSAPQRRALELALARPAAHVWLFSSSEALGQLATLAPGANWSASVALATHGRIAEAARVAGFARVHEVAPSPREVASKVAELARSIQSAPP